MRNGQTIQSRPWVSIDQDKLGISQPLRLVDSPKGKMGLINIAYVLRNTGQSPAFHVRWRSKLIVESFAPGMITNPQTALCKQMAKAPISNALDATIFPDDKTPGSEGIDLSPEDIANGYQIRDAGEFKRFGYMALALVACIDYQTSFSPEHHQTRYAFTLGAPHAVTGGSADYVMADMKIGDFPPVGLRLIYFGQSAN
jgi:hypothetical protein